MTLSGTDEFRQRYSGRFFGKYRAFVTNKEDPRQLGRLMVKVPAVMGLDEELGWALPAAGGGVNTGDFNAPEINDLVWVEFEEGDPTQPVWSPGPWGIRDGENTLPKHSRGVPDDTDYVCREHGISPPSQFAGTYGEVRFIQNRSGGSFLELDDTPGLERLQLSHRTGTRIEMTSDGGFQEIVIAGLRRRIEGVHNVEITGGEVYAIEGASSFLASNERTETYDGALSQSFRNLTQSGQQFDANWGGGWTNQVGGNWTVEAGGQGAMNISGALAFMIRQNLQMTVLEMAEICASNSLNTTPDANAILLHGYNGTVELKATDPTGTAIEANILLKGNSPVSNILLGGSSADEPMILGNTHKDWLNDLLTWLSTHTHPTGTGPSGPPLESADVLLMGPEIDLALSQVIMGKML